MKFLISTSCTHVHLKEPPETNFKLGRSKKNAHSHFYMVYVEGPWSGSKATSGVGNNTFP